MPPTLSILLPVYNAAPRRFPNPIQSRLTGKAEYWDTQLDLAVKSLLNQTYTDFEVLLLNDGSTDETLAVIQHWVQRDRRIRMFHTDYRQGLPRILNLGLRMATAPWVARQDADDYSFPTRLAVQMAYLRAHPTVGLLGTQAALPSTWERSQPTENIPTRHQTAYPCDPATLTRQAWWRNNFVHTSVVFRRSLALAVGGYDDRYAYGCDFVLWHHLLQLTDGANLPEVMVTYQPGALTQSMPIRRWVEYGTAILDNLTRQRTGVLSVRA